MRGALSAVLVFLLAACTDGPGDGQIIRRSVEELPLPGDTRALLLPNHSGSIKLAVIGDAGRGTPPQYEIGRLLAIYREAFRFDRVLMAGDNIYEGPATGEDYRTKFELPYRQLLAEGVTFHAVLGNHDDPAQVHYEGFGMKGHRFYTLQLRGRLPGPEATVFALDSTSLDPGQLGWIEDQLRRSRARWKLVLQHHPLYSPGDYRYTSRVHRLALEPLFTRHGVDAVFSGHEHFYARMLPQRGLLHLISGGGAEVRTGAAGDAPFVARSFDEDGHFLLVEIAADGLHFQAVSRSGRTIDAGVLRQNAFTPAADTADPR